jgi:hypothetical protein
VVGVGVGVGVECEGVTEGTETSLLYIRYILSNKINLDIRNLLYSKTVMVLSFIPMSLKSTVYFFKHLRRFSKFYGLRDLFSEP